MPTTFARHVGWEHPWCKPYKPHAVCFRCRKQFKVRLDDRPNAPPFREVAGCPQCRGPVVNAGFDFRPPPRRDVKAWRELEARWKPRGG